jgi:perosamine synthetase
MPKRYAIPYPRVGSDFGEREIAAIQQLLKSGSTLSQGVCRQRFEEAFRRYVGSKYAFSVTSGTVALELAIHLLDLRAGDEVIVTPQTYQATIQPLLDYKVTVRFADVSPNNLNIDPSHVADLITHRTKAILLVHYGGYPAEMHQLMQLARERDILVVEDAAHALGTRYLGQPAGSLGHIGCFSFHCSKIITTLGEGGMITFDRDDWAQRLERIRANESDALLQQASNVFGQSVKPCVGALYPGNAYTHDCLLIRRSGTNATLSEPAAAVGLVQLERLPEFVSRRQAIANYLADILSNFDSIRVPTIPADVVHPYHLFTFFLQRRRNGIERDDLVRKLTDAGIEVQLRYFPLHLLPEWRAEGHGYGECPTTERLWFDEQMNLPCHPTLSDAAVEKIGLTLRAALDGKRHCGRSASIA